MTTKNIVFLQQQQTPIKSKSVQAKNIMPNINIILAGTLTIHSTANRLNSTVRLTYMDINKTLLNIQESELRHIQLRLQWKSKTNKSEQSTCYKYGQFYLLLTLTWATNLVILITT